MVTSSSRRPARGFTLIELAVAAALLALIVGGMLMPLGSQDDIRRVATTQRTLEEVREALLGFVAANGYFPCPAAPTSAGAEAGGRTLGVCNDRAGLVPWATLGVPRLDSWGRQLRYSITPEFTDDSARPWPYFSILDEGDITVRGDSGTALTTAGTVVAVVMSHGRNGIGAVTDSGLTIPNTSATNTDEQENAGLTGTGVNFHDRLRTDITSAPGGEIDDLMLWLPKYQVMSRLVAARRLPHP